MMLEEKRQAKPIQTPSNTMSVGLGVNDGYQKKAAASFNQMPKASRDRAAMENPAYVQRQLTGTGQTPRLRSDFKPTPKPQNPVKPDFFFVIN